MEKSVIMTIFIRLNYIMFKYEINRALYLALDGQFTPAEIGQDH